MRSDEVIKKAFEEEVKGLVLTEDTYNKMLDYIEDNSKSKAKVRCIDFYRSINKFTAKLHLIDIAEVAIFAFILIIIPIAVKQYKPQVTSMQSEKEVGKSNISSKGTFENKIEEIIEENRKTTRQAIIEKPIVGEVKVYTDIKEIGEKWGGEIEYPTFIPEGYELEKTELKETELTLKSSRGEKLDNAKSIAIVYKNKEDKTITIDQTKDATLVELSQYDMISLYGLNAWIKEDNLVFWSKEKMYSINVSKGIDRNTIVKIGKSFSVVLNPEKWATEWHEAYSEINKIKEHVPFNIEFPKFFPNDYKLESSYLDITKNTSSVFYKINLCYSNTSNMNFNISIASEGSKPEDFLKTLKKVKLGTIEAWIDHKNNGKGSNQVMFWKNGLYYNISSTEVDIETLTKISESFN
jgi:hypothetical protein